MPSPKTEPAAARPPDRRQSRGGKAGGNGRGYTPTDEQRSLVTVMAAMGIPEDQMVLAIINPISRQPISPVTLRKHFREEIDKGVVQANSKVAASLFKNATTATESFPGGIPSAQIFWMKTRARWQQRPELNVPPPPEPSEEVSVQDGMRRAAFLIAVELQEKAEQAPAEPKKKRAP